MSMYEEVRKFIEPELHGSIGELIDLIGEERLDDLYIRHGDITEDYEPAEYWLVSPYLGEKLAKHKEIVWDSRYGNWIWARQTSGQAIALDGVMEDIYMEAKEIAQGIRIY